MKTKYIVSALFLILVFTWFLVIVSPRQSTKIIACDVGQGDAFIITSGTNQIVVDGGPNSDILNCLDEYIPFWDNKIELVVITHPQNDHLKGIVSVFDIYEVDYLLTNSLDISTDSYRLLSSQVGGSSVKVLNPKDGMVIRLGLIYLDILHPGEEFFSENSQKIIYLKSSNDSVLGAYTSDLDPNLFSISFVLKVGDYRALFTGDIQPPAIAYLEQKLSENYKDGVNYIKIPHHGSKNGLTENLLRLTKPEAAVISVGKNSYGHPSDETIQLLKKYEVSILRTDLLGDVVIRLD